MRRRLLPLVLAALPRPSGAQQTPDFRVLDSAIVQEMREGRVPGAAVVVLSRGRVVFARGYGATSVEGGAPVDTGTLFRLASTTKMMTAAGVLALAGRGRLATTTPVGALVRGVSPCVGRATVGQLLSHTGGLADSASERGPHDEAARARWVREWPCARAFLPPGRYFSYSNIGYDLLGEAMAETLGVPYAAAMDSLVFRPLGMTRTTLAPTMAMTWPLALGHAPGADGARVVRPAADDVREWPAGGVFTSAADYGRFLAALLADTGRSTARVGRATLDSMRVPRAAQLDTRPARRAFIGYGFNVRDAGGYTLMQHAGSMLGYGSVVRVIPEDGFAVAILANRTGAVMVRAMERATALVTGRSPSPPPAAEPPTALGAADRRALAGVFGNGAGYLTLRLFARDSTLWLRQEGAADSSRVERAGEGFVTEGTYFGVTRAADGRVELLHIVGHTLRRMPRR